MTATLASTVTCRFLTARSAARLSASLAASALPIGEVLAQFPVERVAGALYAITGSTGYSYLPAEVWNCFEAIASEHGAATLGRYKKLLVARLIGDIDGRIDALHLTPAILANYPDMLDYVVNDMHDSDDAHYLDSSDKVLRELRLCALETVPIGGRVMDLRSGLPRNIYRYHGIADNLRCLWFIYARAGGLAPFYRNHLELRDPKHFSGEREVINVYLVVAEMLERHPEVRGFVGSSWMGDPQLAHISPHLTFNTRLRVAYGAFNWCDGPGELHTQRAIATSRTRRRLYEEGKYVPACYTTIWARRDILRWAESYRRDNGAATLALADEILGTGRRRPAPDTREPTP